MRKQYLINLAKIPKLAKEAAKTLKGGEILALVGPMGAGKTTFVKALAKHLKIRSKVTSPTFTLMHRHQGRSFAGKKIFFCHLDLYRVKNFREVKSLGIEELWNQPDSITAIEWADKIKKHWPKGTFVIKFTRL